MRAQCLLTAVVLLSACHGRIGAYEDKNKWLPDQGFERMHLRSRPRQVTEYMTNARDTSRPEMRHLFFTRYGFNAEGSLTMRYSYMNDTPMMKTDRWLDNDGMQEKITNMFTGKVTRYPSTKLTDGRYRIVTPDGAKTRATIISFLSGGEEILEEYFDDSAATGKPKNVVHTYYEGDRLIRVASEYPEGPRAARYFYSDFDSPDSVLFYLGIGPEKSLLRRQIFFHNDHGDVVRAILIEGKDTIGLTNCRYTYDQKGNWTKKISIPRIARQNSYAARDTVVTMREIVY